MSVIILGIESSCDETSASICKDGKILSNVIATQKIHEEYGGVVPELASRAHMQNIVPVVDLAINKASCKKEEINFCFLKPSGFPVVVSIINKKVSIFPYFTNNLL